jgi:hydroxymethylpyrimidine pyrophosphatase-like HAD family hydrolase
VRIKLIAIDIDGTLLDSRWRLPEANREAVAKAVARGVEVALVTGRRFDFARPIAEMFPCPLTMIVSNGALIKVKNDAGREAGATPDCAGSESGEVYWATELRRLLARETARDILAATLEFRDGAAVIFDRARENQVIFERIDWEDPGRRGYFERNRAFISQVSPLEDCLTEDPIQVMFSGRVVPMRKCAELLRNLSENRKAKNEKRRANSSGGEQGRFALAVTEYEARDFSLVDAIRPDCSKGSALAEWARRRGLAPGEVMAIGDNLNDREMLGFAGLPVVMGNSVSQLKEPGWAVTLSNDEAGVAAAIEKYVLGKSDVVRQTSIVHSP